MSDIKRAAIYLRQSLDLEGDHLAVSRQREDCEEIIARRGWTLVEEYMDNDTSASSRFKPRPAYQRMERDFKAGRFDAIVCWDLDRLTRLPREIEDWIEHAEERGVLVVTVSGDTDLTTPDGRSMARIKATLGRSEMEKKSARQSRAHQQRAQQGRPPRGIRPFGLTLRGEAIPDEAAIFRGIVAAFLKGTSLRAICRQLDGDDQGIRVGPGTATEPVRLHQFPRPSHTLAVERNEQRRLEAIDEGRDPDQVRLSEVPAAHPWNPSSITQMLRNPRVAGFSVYTDRTMKGRTQAKLEGASTHPRTAWYDRIVRGEGGEPVRGQWQQLINPEVWWQVQAKLDDPARKTNRTGSTARTHLGTSLYRCMVCGETLRSHSGDRYRCVANGCVVRSRKPIDNYIRGIVAETLQQPDIIERWVRKPAESQEVAALRQQIADHRGRLARAEHEYLADEITGRDLKNVRERVEPLIAELEQEVTARLHGAMVAPLMTAPAPGNTFLKADLDTQRQIVALLMVVHVGKGLQGRRGFDPATVRVEWLED